MVKEESRRKAVSPYFKKICKCLDDVHSKLARDEVPNGSCEELKGYADLLPETVGDYLRKEKSEALSDLLKGLP
jgi:hypothetical protein